MNNKTDAQLCKLARKRLNKTQLWLGIQLGYSRKSANVSINRVESGNLQLPKLRREKLKAIIREEEQTVIGSNSKFDVKFKILEKI